jgi:hypothetical protein
MTYAECQTHFSQPFSLLCLLFACAQPPSASTERSPLPPFVVAGARRSGGGAFRPQRFSTATICPNFSSLAFRKLPKAGCWLDSHGVSGARGGGRRMLGSRGGTQKVPGISAAVSQRPPPGWNENQQVMEGKEGLNDDVSTSFLISPRWARAGVLLPKKRTPSRAQTQHTHAFIPFEFMISCPAARLRSALEKHTRRV